MIHSGGKLLLLVLLPLIILRRSPRPRPKAGPALGASAAVIAWAATFAALEWSSWQATPAAVSTLLDLITVLVIVFVINAVIEEVFYRRWLQTHIETWLGPWPAIALSTLLWASWHMGIQGVGRPDLDLAAVVLSHAATGVFLGLLWHRYQRMWPLLAVHGALNAAPVLVTYAAL